MVATHRTPLKIHSVLKPTPIKDFLRVLFTPSCWPQIYPYSDAWDAELTRLMSEFEFVDQNIHTAKIGPYEVWISQRAIAAPGAARVFIILLSALL